MAAPTKLFGDIATQSFVTNEGGTPPVRTFILGDKPKFAFSLVEADDATGVKIRNDVPIRSIRASLGKRFAAPTSGAAQLEYDSIAISIPFDATAAEIFDTAEADWNALSVDLLGSSEWRVTLDLADTEPEPTFTVTANTLDPRSFVRIRYIKFGGKWTVELKYLQSPWAFADTWARTLADQPSIERIRSGNTGDGVTETSINEIQSLLVPADFRGTFYLKYDYRSTIILGNDASPIQIEDALNQMWDDGLKRFRVTNPVENEAYIEFIGLLSDGSRDLVEVTVETFQPGTPEFLLDLNTVEFDAALRAADKLENIPFEIEVEVMEPGEDPEDTEIAGRIITFQVLSNCVRQQIFPELAGTVQGIDWLIPPEPTNYIPFTVDQVITGTQYYSVAVGNGVLTSFTVTHNLATDNVAGVLVRGNTSGGTLYQLGTHYTVTFTNANVAVVTWLGSAPATNALLIVIATAGPISAFQAHTHTIAQVVGLQDALDALADRLTAIEDRLPYTSPSSVADSATKAEITIPDASWQYPGEIPETALSKLKEGPVALDRYKILLPANHSSAPTEVTSLPSIASIVWKNTSTRFLVPGGGGHKSFYVETNEFFAGDGTRFYKVYNRPTLKSYFPKAFDHEFFSVPVNAGMLKLGKEMTLTFDLEIQTIGTDVNCQYLALIEFGDDAMDTAPSTTDDNLEDIAYPTASTDDWASERRIIVSNTKVKHTFGVAVFRSVSDVITAKKLLYGSWEDSDDAPTFDTDKSSFLIRFRLGQFDTENSTRDQKGAVWAKLSNAKVSFT